MLLDEFLVEDQPAFVVGWGWHNFGTEIRRQHGLDVSRVLLRQSSLKARWNLTTRRRLTRCRDRGDDLRRNGSVLVACGDTKFR